MANIVAVNKKQPRLPGSPKPSGEKNSPNKRAKKTRAEIKTQTDVPAVKRPQRIPTKTGNKNSVEQTSCQPEKNLKLAEIEKTQDKEASLADSEEYIKR